MHDKDDVLLREVDIFVLQKKDAIDSIFLEGRKLHDKSQWTREVVAND